MHTVNGLVIQGKQEARDRGFPTMNIQLKEPLDASLDGLWICSYSPTTYENYVGVANVAKGGAMLEVHMLDFNRDMYNQEVEIVLQYTIPRLGSMADDINQLKKCSNCRMCTLRDYGYSAWTVEGTESICERNRRPNFEYNYGNDILEYRATTCDDFIRGDPTEEHLD